MLVAAEAVWLWTSGCAAAMKLRSPVARVRALLNRRCCSVAGSLIRSSVNDHENETLTKRTRSLIRNKLRNTKNKFLRKKVFFFFFILLCCATNELCVHAVRSEVRFANGTVTSASTNASLACKWPCAVFCCTYGWYTRPSVFHYWQNKMLQKSHTFYITTRLILCIKTGSHTNLSDMILYASGR